MKTLLAVFLGVFVSFAIRTKCSEEYSLSANAKNDSTGSFVCSTYNVCSGEQAGNLNSSLHDWSERNCMCDENCKIYGDCCLDSRYYNATEQKVNYPLFQCTEKLGDQPLYVKTSCPLTYLDSKVKSKCENYTPGEESEDPKQIKFAFDVQNKIIYGNEYCAQCNGVANTESSNLTFLCSTNDGLMASSLPEFTKILENTHFNSATKTFHSSYNGTTYQCKHENRLPKHLLSLIHNFRPCRPKIISTCQGAYEEKIANLCKSFTSVVYTVQNKIYRNKYCAECSAEKNDLYSCNPLDEVGRGSFSGLFNGAGKLGDYNACASGNKAILSKFC